jgi:hypothetical protein
MKKATNGRWNGIQWTMCNQLDDIDFVGDIAGSFSDNFYNSDGKDSNCVPLILQKNNKLKLQ